MLTADAPPPQTELDPQRVAGLGRRPRPSAAADWLLAAGLVMVCGLFFHRILFGGQVFPWDFISWNYPMQRYVNESLRAGEWPLWNPRVLLGYPIIGDPQANIFNPLFLSYHLLPGLPPIQPNTLAILETAYIALAGVSAFYLARHFGLARSASFLAGLVFMLSGFLPIHVEHTAWVITTAWVPLFLLLAAQLVQRFQVRALLGLSLVTALSIFSGYPQTTLWSLYLVAAYFAWWSLPHLRRRQFRPVVLSGLALGGALLLGAVLAAVQVVPLLEFTVHSTRGAEHYAGSRLGGLEPGAVLTLLLPKLFGSDGRFPYLAGEVTHTQKYLGLLPLVLTLVGAGLAWRRAGSAALGRDARFFLALTVIGFWGSFGARLYLYRVLELLPLVTLFRRAATLFPFALLGMAMLSGLAFERLVAAPPATGPDRGAPRDRPRRSLFAAGPAAPALLLVLLLCALFALGTVWPADFVAMARAAGLQQVLAPSANAKLQAIAAPAFAPALSRICLVMLLFAAALGLLLIGVQLSARLRRALVCALLVFTALDLYWFNAGQIFSVTGRDPFQTVALPPPLALTEPDGLGADRLGLDRTVGPPNFALYAGVEEMGGYNPLRLRRVGEFFSAVPSLNSRSFDLLNVRYLYLTKRYHELADDPATFSALLRRTPTRIYLPKEQLDPQKFVLRARSYDKWFELWENQQALPRFFAASQYRVVPAAAERLALLGQADFDPSQTLILEQPLDAPLAGRLEAPVRITAYSRNAFELQAAVTGGSTLLFMSVPYFPGWHAMVDGRPAPVLVADHAFMALVLPPGSHVVRLAFQPRSFYFGLWVSGLGAAVCLGLVCLRVVAPTAVARRGWPPAGTPGRPPSRGGL